MTVKRRIFLSVPSRETLDPQRQAFVDALVLKVQELGFQLELFFEMGAAAGMSWSAQNVEEIMRRCIGAVVIAFPRWTFTSDDGEMRFASEYAHYEAAAAIGKRLPLLLVVERGLMPRGIVWTGAGFPILFVPESPDIAWLSSDAFTVRFNVWVDQISERHDVFFGYCSKSQRTAHAIARFLRKDLGLRVMDWASDFSAGASILDEIVRAAELCTGGIFLFTQDDFLESRKGQKPAAAPRDNVVFEAGYFAAARGRDRVLIIREEGAKIPADLGGNIFLPLKTKRNIAPIYPAIRSFVTRRL